MADEMTLDEAAQLLGVSRAALYGRLRRERDRGEAVPFRRKRGSRRLTTTAASLLKWAAKWDDRTETKVEPKMSEAKKREASNAAPPAASKSVAAGPLAPSVESAAQATVTEPVVNTGAPVIKELPESYMETKLVVMSHDPDRIVAYWDVDPDTARRFADSRWGLLVKTDAGERLIEIEHGARNWYIEQPDITKKRDIVFGPIDRFGRLVPLARAAWAPPKVVVSVAWGRGVVDENGTRFESSDIAPSADSKALTQASTPYRIGGADSEGLHRPISSFGAPSSEANS